MMDPVRVAYTLEQCWHRVPGGTAVTALRLSEAMAEHDDIRLLGVAGLHRGMPKEPFVPSIPVARLPVAGGWMYEGWLRAQWPRVEWATGRIDIAHATTLIPCPTDAKLVVTIHDLAFVHNPAQFTRHGVHVFNRSLHHVRDRADLVLCCSQTTMDDCVFAGIEAERIRLIPWGVEVRRATAENAAAARRRYDLPEDYLLFVGTVEPRKNLKGLIAALDHLDDPPLLVVAGAPGWGNAGGEPRSGVRFLGFVPDADLRGLYAGASVFCYPSTREGFGLPVLEAMAQGTPVVTSRGTATEEAAGGAGVLVDPYDPVDIARGIAEARSRREELSALGEAHARRHTWARAAALTADAYRELAG